MLRFKIITITILHIILTVNLSAQNGGMNIRSMNVSNSVEVGSGIEKVAISGDFVSLPPLTNIQIEALGVLPEGSIVYSSDSDVLLVFDGIYWKRIDGMNNQYLLPPCNSVFTDYDGNSFQGVLIGEQCWMDRNLEVTHFPDGSAILHVSDPTSWEALDDNDVDAAYCYYNDPSPSGGYGALYTYAAAIAVAWTKDNDDITNGEGGQGICPDGWHLPSNDEWLALVNFLGGLTVAGGKMKEEGLSHWLAPNTGATNESGFTALPGGRRSLSGVFGLSGGRAYWWSANENSINEAYDWFLNCAVDDMVDSWLHKSYGLSVRCLRD